MVNRLIRPLKRWPAFEAAVTRLAGRFTTWPVDDFGRFVSAPVAYGFPSTPATFPPAAHPHRAPEPMSIAPATFEMRFMELHTEGRFDEMWDMLAEDAQRAWGGREFFVRDMPRLDDGTELLDMQVLNVKVLEWWTDRAHDRSYSNVAQMMLRYRVRQGRPGWVAVEATLDRQVHLIPAAGGWRTLCYPAAARGAVKTR
jgi:hypothetical protein